MSISPKGILITAIVTLAVLMITEQTKLKETVFAAS